MLQLDGNVVVDLGDDAYTQGKPHPMIDPAKRIECMQEAVDDPSTGVVLLDIMLGYGSHADMAGSLTRQQRTSGKSRCSRKKSILHRYSMWNKKRLSGI